MTCAVREPVVLRYISAFATNFIGSPVGNLSFPIAPAAPPHPREKK